MAIGLLATYLRVQSQLEIDKLKREISWLEDRADIVHAKAECLVEGMGQPCGL